MAHFAFDLGFQRHLLACFLGDARWARDNLDSLNPEFFGSDLLKGVAETARAFISAHEEPPSKEALLEEVKEFLAPGRKWAEYQEEIEGIFELVGVNTAYYQRKIQEFSKVQLYASALQKSVGFIQSGDVEEAERVLSRVRRDGETFDSGFLYDFFARLKERALTYLHPEESIPRMPTGFYLLDDRMQGGLGKGELGVIVAPPKHGKTTALISIASNCLVSGRKVLYVTLELRRDVILLKFDTNLFGLSSREIRNKPREFYAAMKELKEKIKGGLVVMEYPTKALSLSRLEGVLTKTLPDVVFVDYASIMRSPQRREEKRFEVTDIHEGLRKLAGDCAVPIWTAHQANRPALTTKTVDMEHIAEDLNVAAIADITVSVNQVDDEARRGVVRLHIMGNRLGPSGDIAEYCVNWKLSKIYEPKPEKEDLG